MFNQPIQTAPATQTISRGASTPAPVGGWNDRDSIAGMPPEDALILKNWFPLTSQARVRRGYTEHIQPVTNVELTTEAGDTLTTEAGDPLVIDSAFTGVVESLLPYASGSATAMFAAVNSRIYDATTAGLPGLSLVSGLSSIRFQHVNFGTSAGQYLICVNGADVLQYYDGSSWATITDSTTPSITGIATSSFIHVNVFKDRIIFTQKDSLSFWYLPVDAIGGAATEFDLSSNASLGGHLMASGTWTRDGGDGIDDFAVFYTSQGEVIIYQGTDPGDASAWSLVGVFRVGAPVGRRCMVKIGPDLILLTVDGFIPLSKALANSRTSEAASLSDKIRNSVNTAVRSYGANFGWQGVFYPKGPMLLFNIPTSESSTSEQYVANTTTGAWCRFTNMNAFCWAVYDDDLYFGGSGAVYHADNGNSDNGSEIETDVQQAFTDFGMSGVLKDYKMVRPIFTSDGSLGISLTVNVDYEDVSPTGTPTFTAQTGATWNEAEWDVSDWTVGLKVSKDWLGVNGIGYTASIRMKISQKDFETYWNASDWVYQTGGLV